MGMSFTIIWLTPTNHSQQTKLSIHVPMHGWTADSHSFTPQVDPHRAISWHAIIGMIDVLDYCGVSEPPNLTQRARLYDGESHT